MRRRSSASEGRFGEAEPEGCASIRVIAPYQCYALRTGGDWLWIAARPEASPYHATARRRRYIDNHQCEAFLIASGGGEGRILGLPFARSARQIGGISPHHNCRTAPKRKEGPKMRYSHAVASRGRKASARSHAERTVAAEFRAYREQAQGISGNPQVIATLSSRAPYHLTPAAAPKLGVFESQSHRGCFGVGSLRSLSVEQWTPRRSRL